MVFDSQIAICSPNIPFGLQAGNYKHLQTISISMFYTQLKLKKRLQTGGEEAHL